MAVGLGVIVKDAVGVRVGDPAPVGVPVSVAVNVGLNVIVEDAVGVRVGDPV